jgi:SET domain-containing protein
VVDATETGNVARYLNHSCGPNLAVVPVRVPGDGPRPLLALFATRAIAAGEELTFDYGSHAASVSARPCLCGHARCRGRLPWDPAVS